MRKVLHYLLEENLVWVCLYKLRIMVQYVRLATQNDSSYYVGRDGETNENIENLRMMEIWKYKKCFNFSYVYSRD